MEDVGRGRTAIQILRCGSKACFVAPLHHSAHRLYPSDDFSRGAVAESDDWTHSMGRQEHDASDATAALLS
jgi:hypothetical protein